MRKRSLSALALLVLGSILGCSSSQYPRFIDAITPRSITIKAMNPIGTKFENFSREANRGSDLASYFSIRSVEFKPIDEIAREGKIWLPEIELNYELTERTTFALRGSYMEFHSEGKDTFNTFIPGFIRTNVRNTLDAKVGIIGAAIYHYPQVNWDKIQPYLSLGLEYYHASVNNKTEIESRVLYFSYERDKTLTGMTGFIGGGLETPIPDFLKYFIGQDTKFQIGGEYHEPIWGNGSDDVKGPRLNFGFKGTIPLKNKRPKKKLPIAVIVK